MIDLDANAANAGPVGQKGIYQNVSDNVSSPSHYTQGGIEAIDAIRAALGDEGFHAFCRGNAIKYAWRANRKGRHDEDMKKAAWYSRMASGDDPRKDRLPVAEVTEIEGPRHGALCKCSVCAWRIYTSGLPVGG